MRPVIGYIVFCAVIAWLALVAATYRPVDRGALPFMYDVDDNGRITQYYWGKK